MGEPGSEVWEAVRGALSATRQAAPIERLAGDGDPPLSFAQEGIWLHERLHPAGGAFNTTLALGLDGPLDVASLAAALDAIVRRHEILRTGFVAEGGVPRQRIAPELAVELRRVDLSGLPAAARTTEVERRVLRRNVEPFDLRRPPLWRTALLRLAAASHVLLLSVHHAVWDQSSYGVWLAELAAHYAGAGSGPASALPGPAVQYADLARWERREAEAGRLARQVAYWRRRLEGCAWHLELPRDRLRPAVPTFTGRSRWLLLDGELGGGLGELSRSAGTTLFMTLLAGYAALLTRYGNAAEAVVGVPFSKRYRTELRGLIGPLVNLLLLRLDLGGDPTVAELLARVRGVVAEAYANQEAPYERVTATMRPDAERNGGPRVQTMLTFYRMPSRTPTAGGLELRPFEAEDGKARMDLELYLWEAPDGLHGRFIFDADLFLPATMERVPRHFVSLLAAMVAGPERRLSALGLLGEEERRHLLVAWSGRPSAGPPAGTIHGLFRAQAALRPAATALVAGDGALTYRELDERAGRLARDLAGRGAGAGGLVAVHLERRPGLITALLAILELGAAYVPLDLADPPERTLLMLADSGATLLLTTAARRAQLPAAGTETIVLEEWLAPAAGERPPPCGVAPLAYVTYTSGSTGAPKGIAVPHGAVLDTVLDTDYLTLAPGDRMAQAANVSFDVATAEVWGALLNGATLVMLPPETILAPAALAASLAARRVDSLFLTTALFHRVASEAPHAFGGLRDLLVGGEVLDAHWVRRVLAHGAPRRLLNVYGPTETTAYSTWYRADRAAWEGPRVPIGRPIGRARVYLVDGALGPVPVGVAGEVYLGGPGLARGYLGRPARTAERFVPDPFAGTPGGRLYRTGDLARWLADGDLEFLERIDEQVKIRGNRIELGEIEAALALHPNVRECAVAAGILPPRDGRPREQRLVAYVVPTEERVPEVGELARFLKQRLPLYMVPAAFVPLTAIPLTPSGKVDRLTLAARDRPRATPREGYLAPHNEIERTLAEIWKRVLWLEEDVGIHDDFFDLGGHSLLASVMVAEVEKAFGVELPIGALFRLTTVSDLAGHLEPMVAALTDSLARGLTAPEAEDGVAPQRLSPAIHHRLLAFTAGWRGRRAAPDGGLLVGLNLGGHRPPLFWCLQGFDELQQLARYLGPSQPVFGMRSGHLAMRFTAANIRALAAHYAGEILAAQPDGPCLVGGNCQGSWIAWAVAEELRRRGRPVPLLALQLFDYRHALPYRGRVALFLGADAGERFHRSGAPEPAWSELYPGGFSIDPISGRERWHFVEPHVQDFAGKLAGRIEQALAAPGATAPAAPDARPAAAASRGVVVLDAAGGGSSVAAELVRRLGPDAAGPEAAAVDRRIAAIHEGFLAAVGRRWDDPRPLPAEAFRGAAAGAARAELRGVIAQLASRPRWVVDEPRLCRLLPLWDDLVPETVEVRFLHVLRRPEAAAAVLAEREGLPPGEGLLVWLLHALDGELATRERRGSWLRLETLAAPLPAAAVAAVAAAAGPVDDLEGRLTAALGELGGAVAGPGGESEALREALRFQPWAAAAHRALAALAEGREIEGRVALDALRFGLDEDARRTEIERVQSENDRLREKSHVVWQENLRMREENERLRRELIDRTRHGRLFTTLRWLYTVVFRGHRPA
jgi:amino acid adenylation domain-containing protein